LLSENESKSQAAWDCRQPRSQNNQVSEPANQKLTVLLLVDRRTSVLKRHLVRGGYNVVESYTTDRAVAICVNNNIDAAVLDQACFVETDGWSVAQSLKAVQAHLCVILVCEAKTAKEEMPEGVDAMVSGDKPEAVLAELDRLLRRSQNSATA
jgi:response regulator RpfG family c-di-GMP phosphodiesterase